MNTTTAAAQAHVTVATIRHWCRLGAVAATKTAGRWVIDAASLARRITIGKRRTPAAPALTVETMTAIGGREWQRGTHHRVYLNSWTDFIGLELTHYKSGNISSAALDGRGIANGRVARLMGAIDKVYFDATDGRLHVQHYGAHEFEIRYLDGERDHLDLVERLFAGVRAAIAAL